MPDSPQQPAARQVAQAFPAPPRVPSVPPAPRPSATAAPSPPASAGPTPEPASETGGAVVVAPAASPSPAPSPTPTPRGLAPTRSLATELSELPGIRSLPFQGLVLTGIELLLLFVLYYALRRVVKRVIRDATEVVARREDAIGNAGRATRIRTLAGLTTGLALWTLGFVFFVSALSAVGINVAAIVGTAGVAGLAFGFGAQKLVKDMITGFFILLEDQYIVGDYVTIGTVTGTVEELGMRITRIRDDDGKLYILSNGDIAQVCNQSRGPVSGSFEIPVGAGADLPKTVEVLRAGLEKAAGELGLPEPPKVDGVSAAEALKTVLKITFKAAPGQRPGPLALRLREAARAALLSAEIPLG